MCEIIVIKLAEDIEPLTAFKRRSPEIMKRLKRTKRPLVLTVNGKAAVVVMDVTAFQELIDLIDSVTGIDAGLRSFARGQIRPVDEALDDLRRKHGL